MFLAGLVKRDVPFESFQALEAALGLAATLTRHVAPDIIFLFGDELLLRPKRPKLALVALRTLLDIVAVIAGVDFQPAKGKFPHLTNGPVHEIAVVGDHHDCAFPTVEIAFQPLDSLEVEVVGWLIQQQEVG